MGHIRHTSLDYAPSNGPSPDASREALRELEASRLVESEPHRGTRVRVIGLKEMREAYFARGLLERAAAATATKCFKGNVAKLREEFQGIMRAAGAKDFAEQAAHVYAFHRRILEASGNCVLLRLWESLAFETRIRIRLGWRAIDLAHAETSYEAILTALARGDTRAAGRLLREHAESFAPTVEREVVPSPRTA